QLKESEQICIVMNKKRGASCITTHLLVIRTPIWHYLIAMECLVQYLLPFLLIRLQFLCH
ncbi:hypothetical protein F3F61_03460, partial [Bacteroides ovatus]